MNPLWRRLYHTSLRRQNLSDPFKPKNNAHQETKSFYKEQNLASANKFRVLNEQKDSALTRLVKKLFKPTPLNDNLRVKFNLDKEYKLIYLLDKEGTALIIFGMANLLFPLFFVLVGFFVYAEYTEKSQITSSFENPYMFLATLTAYFSFAYFITKVGQSKVVLRIYHNPKLDRFVMFRSKGVYGFAKEEFGKQNIAYRFINEEKQKNLFISNLTRSQGNIYINNKLKRVEFEQFLNKDILLELFGPKAYNLIQSELKN